MKKTEASALVCLTLVTALQDAQGRNNLQWTNIPSMERSNVSDYLKGLGHAILGNFSTDHMVIELTKI